MTKHIQRRCEICDEREGQIRVFKYIGKQKTEIFVCKQCLFLVGLKEQLGQGQIEFESERGLEHSCPACGWKLGDIVRTGLLGCPKCYETFAAEVHPIMEHFHGSLRSRTIINDTDEGNISILQWQLRKAIAEERFEDAASIRDMLMKMKKKNESEEE